MPTHSALSGLVVDDGRPDQRIHVRSSHALRDMTPLGWWATSQEPRTYQGGDNDSKYDELLPHATDVAERPGSLARRR